MADEVVIDVPEPANVIESPPVEPEKPADPELEAQEPEDEPEGETPSTDDDEPEGGEAPKKRSRPGKYQRKINRLEGNIHTLSEKLEAALDVIARQQGAGASKTQEEAPPDPAKFGDDTVAYVGALASYEARKALREGQQSQQAKSDADAKKASEAAFIRRRDELLAAGADEFEDFEDVALSGVPITQAMAEAVTDSDIGHKVWYHLGTNPTEARRIAALKSPASQAREIGKLEAKILQKPVKKTTAAPKPLEPVGGGGGALTKDPSKMNNAEYRKWRESGGGR